MPGFRARRAGRPLRGVGRIVIQWVLNGVNHFPGFRLDGPIRANRFADSRESSHPRESFQGSRIEPPSLRIALRGPKIANRRFEAICANRSHVYENTVRVKIITGSLVIL